MKALITAMLVTATIALTYATLAADAVTLLGVDIDLIPAGLALWVGTLLMQRVND